MALTKPRFRGVLHMWAALCAVPLGVLLELTAGSDRARAAVAVYAVTLVLLFAVSATYHRIDWRSLAARAWMRRLDHSMIFLVIAGTYTPFAALVLHGAWGLAVLIAVWGGALGGILLNLLWTSAPKWVDAASYVGLGWVVVIALPKLTGLGAVGLCLLGLGGVLYTVGAVVYALGRPDPAPTVFGYHEVFHALVVAAASVQYAVIAFWVLPGHM